MASSACTADQDVVDDTIMTVPQVPQVAGDGSELVYNIIELRADELDYVERNKWIDQLAAKFRFLYSSLLDYQSNQFPSLTLLLNPGSLDQQSVVNQIQVGFTFSLISGSFLVKKFLVNGFLVNGFLVNEFLMNVSIFRS